VIVVRDVSNIPAMPWPEKVTFLKK